MRQADFREPRTCVTCERSFAEAELQGPAAIGWTPLQRGWRCPACSREHVSRVDAMARSLVGGHRRHLWVGSQEHTGYDECVWCDVIARATALLLERPAKQSAGKRSDAP